MPNSTASESKPSPGTSPGLPRVEWQRMQEAFQSPETPGMGPGGLRKTEPMYIQRSVSMT